MKRKDEHNSILSDEQIIELYWKRSEDAITETDKKYGKLILRIANNILHDVSDSEECKNDTYIGIWNAIPPTKPKVFPAFITQIMRNIAINRYKEKSAKKHIPSNLTSSLDELNETLHSENHVEKEYDAKELGRIISDYIRTLPKRKSDIFIERFYFAESIEKIASIHAVSIPTVYREIEKIKQDLKKHLEENGVFI